MYRKTIRKLKRYQKTLNGAGPGRIVHSMRDNPIGTYFVKLNGQFIWCSEECRVILGIPVYATIEKWNIRDFYYDPNYREELLKKMEHSGHILRQEVIPMHRHGSETPIFVEDFCQMTQQGKEIGFFGEIRDVTNSASYQKLFDELSAGVFRLGKEGEFQMLNPAVSKILGEYGTEDLIGRKFLEFWFSSHDYVQFIEHLQHEHELVQYHAKLLCNKQPSYVMITAKVWRDGNDDFLGYEGTITDNTTAHKLERAFEKFSTGYFETRGNGENHHICNCNTSFAKMLGYDSPKELNNRPILDIFYSNADKEAVNAQVQHAYKQKPSVFQKLLVQMRRKDGTPLWAQLDCILHLNKRNQITGYEGILVNVDDHKKAQAELEQQRKLIDQTRNELALKQAELDQNREKVDHIMKDMDKFIHKFIAPMMNIDSTVQQLGHMAHIRFQRPPTTMAESDQQANAVVNSLTKLIDTFENEHVHSPFLPELKTKKSQLQSRKRLYRDPSLCDLWVREMNMDIYELMTKLIRKIEPTIQDQYPIIEDTLQVSEKLLNSYILDLILRIRDNTKINNQIIESLRRRYYTGEKRPVQFFSHNIMEVLRRTIASFTEMAQEKSLRILPPEQHTIIMEISEPLIESMFSNLIHNAIKYSYKRQGAYVRVSAHVMKNDVKFTFENYGVAITPEDRNRLLEYGYRGKLSYDHNRTGSGIGLADVDQTLKKHHGRIYFHSNPAPGNTTETDYTVPFVTKIIVILPKKQEKK